VGQHLRAFLSFFYPFDVAIDHESKSPDCRLPPFLITLPKTTALPGSRLAWAFFLLPNDRFPQPTSSLIRQSHPRLPFEMMVTHPSKAFLPPPRCTHARDHALFSDSAPSPPPPVDVLAVWDAEMTFLSTLPCCCCYSSSRSPPPYSPVDHGWCFSKHSVRRFPGFPYIALVSGWNWRCFAQPGSFSGDLFLTRILGEAFPGLTCFFLSPKSSPFFFSSLRLARFPSF